MRFPLQQVTAVAVDTETPVLAAEALVRTMAMVDFGRAVLFTTGWLPPRIIPGLDVIEVDPLPTAGARDAFLRQHRCDVVQGYWLSPPLQARQCLEFVHGWPEREGSAMRAAAEEGATHATP